MAADVVAVREAIASLARSFKRVSVYRHARDQHAGYLESALSSMRALLQLTPSVTMAVEPTALVFEGEVVHSEPARETGFCFRLHRDGVRSLTFRRGLGIEELVALAYVTMADPQAEGGREDAVTELWKADLSHVGYSAGTGYRMDESGGNEMHGTVAEIAARAQEAIERNVSDAFVELSFQSTLWTEEQRKQRDPADHAALARRGAVTILRIVEQDSAGWDLEALQETFTLLLEQMIERQEGQALTRALAGLGKLGGEHAGRFREVAGRWLSQPSRIERVAALAASAERAPLLARWLPLLSPEAGPPLVNAIASGHDPSARKQIAAAALSRIDSCAEQLDQLMRTGAAPQVQAVLSELPQLPAARRAGLAEAAFANPDANVRLEAIPVVASEPPLAVRALGPALAAPVRAVRVAAAQALAGCGELAEEAASLLLTALSRPQFSQVDKEEQTVFYRSLGKLGSSTGFSFLLERLARPPRRFFQRRRAIDEQLLAVQGLADEASQRSLRALEEAMIPARGHAPAVVAASRAAVQHLRERIKGGQPA